MQITTKVTFDPDTNTDGAAWTMIGQYAAALTNAKIGLTAANNLGSVPEIPAGFDHFEVLHNGRTRSTQDHGTIWLP